MGRREPEGDSALVLLAPGAEPIVRELRNRFDPAADLGIGAHITVLYPFMPISNLDDDAEAAVAALAGRHAAFDLTLMEVRQWPEVVYLAVDPEGPVRDLTEEAVKCWPQHPPYGGVFDGVVPHLTIGHGGDDLLAEALASVAPLLPVTLRMSELSLLLMDGERWSRIRAFPLGE